MKEAAKGYAPVIIPTLNRYEHLKRCVESLACCMQAENTELIIGLDYPPTPKYENGWLEIRQYLPTITGFKKVTILNRERNYGAVANMNDLIEYALKSYDYYIFTEDDNVFSPNFLDYMNKGLALYENNPKVMALCGYSYFDIEKEKHDGNVMAYRKYSAWGVGHWRCKNFVSDQSSRSDYCEAILKSWKNSVRLWRIHPISINDFLSMHFRKQIYGDSLANAMLCLEGKYCVFPKVSLVRNCGHDGSGEHCSETSVFVNQKIDDATSFTFDELIYSSKFPNDTYYNKIVSVIAIPLVSFFRYLWYRMFDKDLFGFYFKR